MVLDAAAKMIRLCAQSKTCWNGKIEERRSQLGREKRRRCRSVVTAQAKAGLQKSIRRAKDRMRNDYLKSLWRAEVWREVKFANPRAGSTVEALTERDGTHADTITKREEMQRRESFPLHEHDQYIEQLPAGQALQSLTQQAVEPALFAQSVRNARVPDKLCSGAVHLRAEWERARIDQLPKAVVHTG